MARQARGSGVVERDALRFEVAELHLAEMVPQRGRCPNQTAVFEAHGWILPGPQLMCKFSAKFLKILICLKVTKILVKSKIVKVLEKGTRGLASPSPSLALTLKKEKPLYFVKGQKERKVIQKVGG